MTIPSPTTTPSKRSRPVAVTTQKTNVRIMMTAGTAADAYLLRRLWATMTPADKGQEPGKWHWEDGENELPSLEMAL